MQGIYIHIPFCRKACHYCDFHFSTNFEGIDPLVSALGTEMHLKAKRFEEEIQTLYLGGGTPSAIPIKHLSFIMDRLLKYTKLAEGAEITLEANPEDINPESLQSWWNLGFNRLSIGIQSLDDDFLGFMNRNHNAEVALNALQDVKSSPFTNYSFDIMYGKPGINDDALEKEVATLMQFNPVHISAYCLTVEERTALFQKRKTGVFIESSDDEKSKQFKSLVEVLKTYNIQQYEVSNFAQPGWESKHNSNYWEGIQYLGIGPGAHEFDGTQTRRWNLANNPQYIRLTKRGQIPEEVEHLSSDNQWNETLLTGLRRIKGIHLPTLQARFSIDLEKRFEREIESLLQKNWISLNAGHLCLTEDGMLMADHIAAEFFLES